MPTYSQDNFVKSVLKELGIIAASETPTAQDALDVKETLDQVLNMLDWEYLYTWDEPNNEIPSDKFRPLVQLVANELATQFGIEGQQKLEFEQRAIKARIILERQTDDFDEEPTQITYF